MFDVNSPDQGFEQRQYRHVAYRLFVYLQHGCPVEGNKVVLPSCSVWKIKEKFQYPRGHFTGYRVLP